MKKQERFKDVKKIIWELLFSQQYLGEESPAQNPGRRPWPADTVLVEIKIAVNSLEKILKTKEGQRYLA